MKLFAARFKFLMNNFGKLPAIFHAKTRELKTLKKWNFVFKFNIATGNPKKECMPNLKKISIAISGFTWVYAAFSATVEGP